MFFVINVRLRYKYVPHFPQKNSRVRVKIAIREKGDTRRGENEVLKTKPKLLTVLTNERF